jgi:hypothetical protein
MRKLWTFQIRDISIHKIEDFEKDPLLTDEVEACNWEEALEQWCTAKVVNWNKISLTKFKVLLRRPDWPDFIEYEVEPIVSYNFWFCTSKGGVTNIKANY